MSPCQRDGFRQRVTYEPLQTHQPTALFPERVRVVPHSNVETGWVDFPQWPDTWVMRPSWTLAGGGSSRPARAGGGPAGGHNLDHDEDVCEATRAGASGFLLKTVRPASWLPPSATWPPAMRSWPSHHPPTHRAARAPPTAGQRGPARAWRADPAGSRGAAAGRPGGSNAEIAAALVVGETTVRTHVTRILAKLGVRDRAQAVVAAVPTESPRSHGSLTPVDRTMRHNAA
jgi:hypothetical protein